MYFLVLFFKADKDLAARTLHKGGNYSHSGWVVDLHAPTIAELLAGAQLKDTDELEAEFLMSDEVVDEDPTSCFSLKYKLLARRQLIRLEPSVNKYQQWYSETPPSFSGLVSYKYLLQRALRI